MEKLNGVYALMNEDEIIYVGQSNDVLKRIRQHKCDGIKEFDSFYAYITEDMRDLEAVLIDSFNPEYNKKSEQILCGNHKGCEELRETIRKYQKTQKCITNNERDSNVTKVNADIDSDNHDFIAVISKMRGVGMGRIIDEIIDFYRENNSELNNTYLKLKNLRKEMEL